MDPIATSNVKQNLDPNQKCSLTNELAADVARDPASVADVYILVGRNVQSQSGLMRKTLTQRANALTKHWVSETRGDED